MTKHSTINTLSVVESHQVWNDTWGLVVACDCGMLLTAISSTQSAAWQLIQRKLAAHARV